MIIGQVIHFHFFVVSTGISMSVLSVFCLTQKHTHDRKLLLCVLFRWWLMRCCWSTFRNRDRLSCQWLNCPWLCDICAKREGDMERMSRQKRKQEGRRSKWERRDKVLHSFALNVYMSLKQVEGQCWCKPMPPMADRAEPWALCFINKNLNVERSYEVECNLKQPPLCVTFLQDISELEVIGSIKPYSPSAKKQTEDTEDKEHKETKRTL